jgi:hypothetical protein
MKKLYFLLAFIAFSLSSFSQRTIDIELSLREIGNSWLNMHPIAPNETLLYDGVTKHYFRIVVKNLGPDSLVVGDSVHVRLAVHKITGHFQIDTIFMSKGPGMSMAILPISGSSNGGFTFTPPPGAPFPYTATLNWCDSVWVTAGASNTPLVDPDFTNNFMCDPVKAQAMWAVNVDDVTREQDFRIYPNPATDKLHVEFDPEPGSGEARLLLRNVMGQEMYARDLHTSGTVTHSIDVSHLPAGVYTAELHYEGRSVIKRVSIQ